jgi:HPt (histidine-containing phosphotransfer) domain-containing protein
MTRAVQGFPARLSQDLDPEDLRSVLSVFRQDVNRLTGVLDGTAAAGDSSSFRRACHSLAGAAGAVGATALAQACRDAMARAELSPAQLRVARAEIRALGAAALDDMETFLAALPQG